ncbi:MAG: hypothetical protein HP490_08165 [Nitrospira sp.]|nr:hypothetical protein [Nitrospira sp.]MBH0187036.1 hypothetical protein [Nitrospira sp.]
MELHELLDRLVSALERLQIPYLITGSVAAMAYGEPRLTNDIDVVVDINEGHVNGLLAQFPSSEFYLSNEAIRDALARKGQFNIIHPASGLKIDVMIQQGTAFEQSRFGRARLVHFTERQGGRFAAPEDVILKKMEYYREGGSEKHLRDIAGILKVSAGTIDESYIGLWANQLGLLDIWEAVLRRLRTGS